MIFFSSCKEKADFPLDYCRMLELDQSHVNSDRSDSTRYEQDRAKRHAIFKKNFQDIIDYADMNGFPSIGSLKSTGVDSCRTWAVSITLFHVGQSQPYLFFEYDTRKLLEREIIAGRLNSKALFPPLREGFRNHEFCLEQKEEIITALDTWQLDVSDLPEIEFVNCQE